MRFVRHFDVCVLFITINTIKYIEFEMNLGTLLREIHVTIFCIDELNTILNKPNLGGHPSIPEFFS